MATTVQEEILEACRKIERLSGFKFSDHWASVISGKLSCLAFVYCYVFRGLNSNVYSKSSILGSDKVLKSRIIELGCPSAQV